MAMDKRRWLTIHFTDDTQMKFDFYEQERDDATVEEVTKRILDGRQISLEVEGVLYVFPLANVKYIRVSPCPQKMPDTTIKGVVLSGS